MNNTEMKRGGIKRNSNIEALRIISMILIIAFHALGRGEIDISTGNSNEIITSVVLGSWGILGVDLFIIISSWYLIDAEFKCQRIINIIVQVASYFIIQVLIYIAINVHILGIKGIVSNIIFILMYYIEQPLWCNMYWFVSAYILLVMISPILNRMIVGCDRKNYEKVLIIISFVPIIAQHKMNTLSDMISMVYIYLLVAYIKRYRLSERTKYLKSYFIPVLMLSVIVSELFVIYAPDNIPLMLIKRILKITIAAIGRHSIILMLIAFIIFFNVMKMKENHNTFVNSISALVFGVYLFHENDGFLLPNLTDIVMDKRIYLNSLMPSVCSTIILIILIFVVSIVFEYLRNQIIQKPVMAVLNKRLCSKFDTINNWMNQ